MSVCSEGDIYFKTHSSESERMNFYTESRDVFFFKFTSQMALHEGGLGGVTLAVRSSESQIPRNSSRDEAQALDDSCSMWKSQRIAVTD